MTTTAEASTAQRARTVLVTLAAVAVLALIALLALFFTRAIPTRPVGQSSAKGADSTANTASGFER